MVMAGAKLIATNLDPSCPTAHGLLPGAGAIVRTIEAATGKLTTITGSPFSAGSQPIFILAEPAGTYLYVGNQGSTNVTGYSYDATTGKLTTISGSPFTVGSAPGAMTIVH